MQKTAWTLSAVIVAAAAGGGAYHLAEHQTIEPTPSVEEHLPVAPAPEPKIGDDDLTRRKLEGIGSTRDLKPVPIP